MEANLVIFLAFVSVTLVMNTLLIWFAYRGFANMTTKVCETMVDFERSGVTKEWVASLSSAAERAAQTTETAKRQFAEFDPVIDQARQRYARTLSRVDAQLAEKADQISAGAQRTRDFLAKPAFSFMAIVAGVNSVLNSWEPDDDGQTPSRNE